MGEYINYKGQRVKIGTCESLYYVTYDKYLAFDSNKSGVSFREFTPLYLRVEEGFMFRFPFPDEDNLSFGRIIEPHDRTIPVSFDKEIYDKNFGRSEADSPVSIGIAMQKPIFRESDGQFCLALIVEDYRTKKLYRIEEKSDAKIVVGQIVRNHVLKESSAANRDFYRKVASRILKGYNTKLLLSQREYLSESKNLKEEQSPKESKVENSNIRERSHRKGKRMGR